jgi:monoamine oxidase
MQNKKIYNISIIGGGISGCISALLLSKLGHKITLFEKKEALGGTMVDIKKIDEIFFNGPQYFDNNSEWLKYIKKSKFFKNHFYDFNYSYMFKNKQMNVFKSYIDLFDDEIVNDLFAQPIVKKIYIKLKNKKKAELLKDRLDSYQNNIRKPIEKWCRNFSSHYDTLHESCSAVLGVTRVMFAKNQDLVKKLKLSNENADKLLGLPTTFPKQKFSIPKKGYNIFFYNLEKILRKKIKIKLNAKIKVIKKGNGVINLYNKSELINTDKIVWAANPITLLTQLGYRNFDNPIMRVKLYCANINFIKNYGSQNFYIQVYSKKTNIFRIYIYKLKNKFKIAIETFIKNKFEQLDKALLIKILKKFKIEIDILDTFIEKKEIRHNLITKSDYDRFLMFEKKYINTKIIGGGWHLFGRDKKINYIMSKF